jgi:catechol 2,3-dioxygenase
VHYGISAPNYRLPQTTHVGTVQLAVSDLVRSRDYYTTALGLRVVEERGDRISLAAGANHRPLLQLRAGAHPFSSHRAERLGLYHFALLVPDRGALGSLIAHLSLIGVPIASADHAVSEAIYLWDPDGLGIEVYADRPRAEWRVHGRELYMNTERLNVGELLELSRGVVWTGPPTGTVVGHIHLHVGDLDRARDFYHGALGFDQIVWSYPGALFLSAGGYHHHLGTNTWAANAAPRRDDEPGLIEWELVVPPDEVERARATEPLAGYEIGRDETSALYRDVWGTRVRLTALA